MATLVKTYTSASPLFGASVFASPNGIVAVGSPAEMHNGKLTGAIHIYDITACLRYLSFTLNIYEL